MLAASRRLPHLVSGRYRSAMPDLHKIKVVCGAALFFLSACADRTDSTPDEAELHTFMNKLEADEKAGKDAAVANAREEESNRAADAESRLKDYSKERR